MRSSARPTPWMFVGVALTGAVAASSRAAWIERLPFWALAAAGVAGAALGVAAAVFALIWVRLGCPTPEWVHRLALGAGAAALALLLPDHFLHPDRLSLGRCLFEAAAVGLSTYLFWAARAATGPSDPSVTKFQRNNLFLLQRLQK